MSIVEHRTRNVRSIILGVNDAVAAIHKFLGGGGKKFNGVVDIFFAPSCQKPRISTPYRSQFMNKNVLKLDMHVHILNFESMKPIKNIFGETWGGGAWQPSCLRPILFSILVESC